MAKVMAISAKKLGELAMSEFCPRCFWIRMQMQGDPPFNCFPRIFTDIDYYTKRVVHAYFDETKKAPGWLKDLGDLVDYVKPPHSSVFRMPLGENILLKGEADGIFKFRNGTLVIVDYKTAFYRGVDDPLYPIYKVQLNAYAMLAQHHGIGKVSSLALIYAQPCTGEESAKRKDNRRDDGFALGFRTQILPIPIDEKQVLSLADEALRIYEQPACPAGKEGCRDCQQVQELINTQKRVFSSVASYAAAFGAA